jgi:hypothetical protein
MSTERQTAQYRCGPTSGAKSRFLVALWCAVGAVALLGGCTPAAPLPVGASGTSLPVPEATVVAVITALPTTAAHWTTYTDAALGYSLSFPDDVEFSSGTARNGVYTARLQFQIPGVDGYQGMVLRVEPNPQNAGVETLVQEIYQRSLAGEQPPAASPNTKPVTVAALPAVQVGEVGDFSLVLPYADHVYIIAPVHDFATTSIDPQALALFYQVLATLEIKR